jgi:hypothetical protein
VLLQAVNGMRKSRTTIIVAHRLSTVMDADIIVVLKVIIHSSGFACTRHVTSGPYPQHIDLVWDAHISCPLTICPMCCTSFVNILQYSDRYWALKVSASGFDSMNSISWGGDCCYVENDKSRLVYQSCSFCRMWFPHSVCCAGEEFQDSYTGLRSAEGRTHDRVLRGVGRTSKMGTRDRTKLTGAKETTERCVVCAGWASGGGRVSRGAGGEGGFVCGHVGAAE